jgi:hypothetical protein
MVRPNALPGAARVGGMTKFMSKIPVIGAIIGAAVGGNAVKDEPGTLRARTDLVNWYASKTGSEANADSMNAPTRYTVKPRETVVAPGGTSPVVPSKTLSATPVAPTPKGSSSPTSSNARTAYHKPSNASGSKGRAMSGAELANYLGLKSDSAVRTYMETGKHKYPTKK